MIFYPMYSSIKIRIILYSRKYVPNTYRKYTDLDEIHHLPYVLVINQILIIYPNSPHPSASLPHFHPNLVK